MTHSSFCEDVLVGSATQFRTGLKSQRIGMDSEGTRIIPATAPATLALLLQPSAIPLYGLRKTHAPRLRLQRSITGAALFADTILAAHMPALEAFLHLTPSCLIMSDDIGTEPFLAMHFAARASNSIYTTVLSAAIAARQGVPGGAMRLNKFSDRESVVVDFALRMGTTPSSLSSKAADALAGALEKDLVAVESVVLTVAFGGLVGRLTRLLASDIEAAVVQTVDFLGPIGWIAPNGTIKRPSESLQKLPSRPVRTDLETKDGGEENASSKREGGISFQAAAFNSLYGRNLPSQSPGEDGHLGLFASLSDSQALKQFDASRIENVPADVTKMERWLATTVGHHFPVVGKLTQEQPRRALAAALHESLTLKGTPVSTRVKYLAAFVLANIYSNRPMAAEFKAVLESAERETPLSPLTIATVESFARQTDTARCFEDPRQAARELVPREFAPELVECEDLTSEECILLIAVKTATVVTTADLDENRDAAVPRPVVYALGKPCPTRKSFSMLGGYRSLNVCIT
jgi:hypothetical protein